MKKKKKRGDEGGGQMIVRTAEHTLSLYCALENLLGYIHKRMQQNLFPDNVSEEFLPPLESHTSKSGRNKKIRRI